MKAKIFDTSTECFSSILDVQAALGIPKQGTNRYAQVSEIIDSESTYFGKFTFPIMTEGEWKCDNLFESSELVDWDDSWFNNVVEE